MNVESFQSLKIEGLKVIVGIVLQIRWRPHRTLEHSLDPRTDASILLGVGKSAGQNCYI